MVVALHFGIHVIIDIISHMYICCTYVAYCLLLALVAMGSSCRVIDVARGVSGIFSLQDCAMGHTSRRRGACGRGLESRFKIS